MYERILFPFDGSDGATEVLHHAGELAQWTDGSIRLLYVADTNEVSVTRADGGVLDGLIEQGEQILAEAGETLDTLGVRYTADVVQGTPAETIVEYGEEHDFDVIVMPTRGRQGLSRYLLGSVTEKVVRLSETPVLTARMVADEKFVVPFEQILVPTDGSKAAESATEHAVEVAAAMGADVHALSVVDTGAFSPDVRSERLANAGETHAAEVVDTVANTARERGIDGVTTHVESGSPAKKIHEIVDREGIDAVVMGTTGRQGVERILLGSVAEKTVRSVPVPVITVRNGPRVMR
ncbi:universal stress protein [Halapricum hydrolyticum]|uniref:Universal stress protein n=1 Tax=Halapricum hydrolyticum TaxID=2979991 RepID=A0AAE3IA35_9EURY|nr:universal stress protein [Halapricum hydrolyticum]MCU4717539.1 universal stress protein [Halapricum hydrolyticum]MCU4726703.1 universal stress protein [Halapricum hydrolyticum]